MASPVTTPAPAAGTATLVGPAPQPTGLWGRYRALIRRLMTEQVDATGLAFFRMAFCTMLLGEVAVKFYFRAIIFDLIPGLAHYELDFTFILLFWMAAIVLVILGLFTRPALLVNYVMCVLFLGTPKQYEYHMDWTWLIASALLLFVPVERRFSLDRLIARVRFSDTRRQYVPPTTVNKLSYYILIFFCIAVMYSTSMLCKLPTHLWLSGMGVWAPASVPFAVHLDTSWILNQHYLVVFLGYFTLAFEFLFVFLTPFRRLRPWLALIGFGLHLGIFFEFPIPWFALGWCALYILVLPPEYWTWLTGETTRDGAPKSARPAPAPALTFYYDAECPLCARTRAALSHFDHRGAVRFRSVQHGAAEEPALTQVPPAALYADIHVVRTADGRVFRGLDAYTQVLATVWYLRPLSWLLRLPGISAVARAFYRRIADGRTTERCTEETCGYLVPPVPAPDSARRLLRNLTMADLKQGAVAGGIAFLLIAQLAVSYISPLVVRARTATGLQGTAPDRALEFLAYAARGMFGPTLGIVNHDVFVDAHFAGYNHTLAVTYVHPDGREEWLPITRPTGQPTWYQYSGMWARWCFRTNGPNITQDRLFDSLQDWTAFWASEHGIPLANARFNLKVKGVDVTLDWQPDYLHHQMARPWYDGGYVQWTNYVAEPHLKVIEKMTNLK